MAEDYRAGLGIDRRNDEADRAAGRRIRCPTLVLLAEFDDLPELYGDPLELRRPWAADVRGHALKSGHHLAEEVPVELARDIDEFLTQPGPCSTT